MPAKLRLVHRRPPSDEGGAYKKGEAPRPPKSMWAWQEATFAELRNEIDTEKKLGIMDIVLAPEAAERMEADHALAIVEIRFGDIKLTVVGLRQFRRLVDEEGRDTGVHYSFAVETIIGLHERYSGIHSRERPGWKTLAVRDRSGAEYRLEPKKGLRLL